MNNYKDHYVIVIADVWQYLQYYLIDKLGLKIILFQSPDRKRVDKKEICEEIYYFDLEDINYAIDLAQKLHEKYNLKAVCSFSDNGVELASVLGQHLKLRHNPLNASVLVNNKALLRGHLNQLGISEVNYQLCHTQEEIIDFVTRYDYPIILKPLKGTASKGVFCAKNELELDEYLLDLSKEFKEPILLEEFLDGDEISVETISFDGEHHILEITDKLTVNQIEFGHIMPSNTSLKEEITTLISKLLESIDHRTGPCHIEVKLTSKGPKIIEAHTRPGGDFIVLLLAEIFGVDVLSLTVDYLISGIKPKIDVLKDKGGAVRYFSVKPGTVQDISGFDEVIKKKEVLAHELNIQVGDIVKKVTDSFGRTGCLVVQGNSADEAFKIAERLVKRIKVITV